MKFLAFASICLSKKHYFLRALMAIGSSEKRVFQSLALDSEDRVSVSEPGWLEVTQETRGHLKLASYCWLQRSGHRRGSWPRCIWLCKGGQSVSTAEIFVYLNYFIYSLHRFFQGNYNNDEAMFQQYTLQPAEITGKVWVSCPPSMNFIEGWCFLDPFCPILRWSGIYPIGGRCCIWWIVRQ